MACKIRIILDVEDDVIRDLIVSDTINLEDLHYTIAKSFGFNGTEMASFFRTNEYWEQGDEIPLFNMSDDETAISMVTCKLEDVLAKKGDKLIYVYDFLYMWTFFVELVDKNVKYNGNLPSISLSVGNTPRKAPEKEFIADDDDGFYDNIDMLDDENDFEGFEDNSFDNY